MGRGLHLALNSGHDGWFPDVIHWNCAAPSRRLMKTHAWSGASQMIPGPPVRIRSACRCVRFRSIVHANGVHVSPRPRSFLENSRVSTSQPLRRFSSCLPLCLCKKRGENAEKNCADFYGYFVLRGTRYNIIIS